MIELPEAIVVAGQIGETFGGKQIVSAVAGMTPHTFAWYTGNPAEYNDRLAGKVVGATRGTGVLIEFEAGDMTVSIGAPTRYHAAGAKRPAKHQLLIEFEDGAALTASCQMWGTFFCAPTGSATNWRELAMARTRPSPLTPAFTRAYFDSLWDENTGKLAAKPFLATEQRIPGLGNGVLQDILWTARIHPKRKMATLSDEEKTAMYEAVKSVLAAMTAQGGRDTEGDLFGKPGGYVTILSKNTVDTPCPACGAIIRKEAFMGGAIYYCPVCQPL